MKKILKNIVIIFLLLLFIPINIYAGDMLYHIMYGHQDYLAIGQVVSKKDNIYSIEISELIESASIRKDIPKVIEVEIDVNWLNEKDNVLLSLSKRGGGYKIENGAHKLTTNDTDTLEVVNTISLLAGEDAALELFLKSRGAIKDFYFQVYEAYVSKTPNLVSDTDLCIYTPETGKTLPTEYEKNEKYIVKSESNNVFIIVSIIILVLIILVLFVYLYFRKKKEFRLRKFLKEKFKKKEVDKDIT